MMKHSTLQENLGKMDISREAVAGIKRKLSSRRCSDVYNACVDIRKNLIKTPRGISRLIRDQVLHILLGILKRTSSDQSSTSSLADANETKVKDIICSILGNVCMDSAAREEVLKHDGVNVLGNILCTVEVESIQNRCCRCIANLCLSSTAWKPLHDTEVVEKIVKLLKDSENSECQLTYIRALRLLGQTGPLVQKLLDQSAVSAVMKYVDSDSEPVAKSALVCITHLLTRRNTIQFASQVVSSGKLPHLVAVVKATESSQDPLLILTELSEQHNFRPAFGSAGGITLFKNLLEKEYFTGKEKIISVLCLCCKDAVNRVKLREEEILKLFIEYLKEDTYKTLHLRIITALVCFLYDEASFDILLEHGLVTVLVSHLRKYLNEDVVVKQIKKTQHSELKEQNAATAKAGSDKQGESALEKFDETAVNLAKNVEIANQRVDKIVNKQQNLTNEKEEGFENAEIQTEGKAAVVVTTDENLTVQIENRIWSDDPLALSTNLIGDNKPLPSKENRVYSIDSPSYQIQDDNDTDYGNGAKCKKSFSPPAYLDNSYEVYSPISNVSYYSPVKSSPECSPQSNRSTSPVNAENYPLYSYCGLGSPYGDVLSSPESCSSVKSPSYQTDVDADKVWSSSSGESQNSSSDDDLSAPNEKKDEIYTDYTKEKKEMSEKNESVVKGTRRLVEKKALDVGKENVLTITASYDEKEKTKNKSVKRKKSDDALENSILILMSRVSQITNPTVHFVATETITCLLDYIIEMETPLARAARLLSRVFRNPHCFQKLLTLKIPVIIYQKLLKNENVPDIIKRINLLKTEETKLSVSTGFRSRSSSFSSVSSDSSRFSLFGEKAVDEELPAKRQKHLSSAESIKREVRGVLHKQAEEVCDPGKCGLSFLEDLTGVSESPYGRGVVEKLVKQDQATRDTACLSLLYLCRSQGTVEFFNKFDIFNNIFTMLEERQLQKFSIIVQGFSLLAHLMNFKSRFQSSRKEDIFKNAMAHTASYVNSQSIQESSIELGVAVETDEILANASLDEDDTSSFENKPCYMCKECLCTLRIPCVLHSNHTCVSKDVTFIVKGERLAGCRNTLTKSSELFAAMLEGHYSESSLSEIELSETSKFAFRYLLHYLHGCKPTLCGVRNYFLNEISVKSSKRLIKVLKEADKYLLYDLKFELQDLLFDRYIIPGTAVDIFEYAVMYDSLRIQKAAVSCFLVDTLSQHKLLLEFQKFLDSKFAGVFINILMELLLD